MKPVIVLLPAGEHVCGDSVAVDARSVVAVFQDDEDPAWVEVRVSCHGFSGTYKVGGPVEKIVGLLVTALDAAQ